MGSLHLDAGPEDACTLSHQAAQFQRILAATEGDEYAVAILQQMIVHTRFVELPAYSLFHDRTTRYAKPGLLCLLARKINNPTAERLLILSR